VSVITFLSDYGYTDEFVGVCHGVLATWCPQARVIDITHGIRRHDIRAGAVALRGAVPYMPPGVHLAVVDPDVGRPTRRAVAIRTAARNHLLVGPDNGLLALAAARLGGVVEAIDIGDSPYRLDPVCATFHGRDIFSPVAAALASGAKLAETGQPFDPGKLKTIDLQRPRIEGGRLVAQVLTIDQFGNVELNVDHPQIAEFGLRLGMALQVTVDGVSFAANYSRAFADVRRDSLLVYEDAQEQLAVAVNHGSAAERLGIARDAELSLQIV
jgi:S-adenosylmethionine hydrolase